MGNGLSYRVPMFQRDYSWGPDEWDDLWQDIVALFGEDPEPAHYMGYLVLQSADNRAFDIIDEQQRMTTLSLLMLAAVAHLAHLSRPDDPDDPQRRRAEQLRGNYIGYLDPVSLVSRSKLTLNRHNDRFYQNYLVPLEHLPQRGLNASEHLLRRAFLWFRDRIEERTGDDGEAVARFVDGAVDRLFFTIITVTDELNAFKVFETLNARGEIRSNNTDGIACWFVDSDYNEESFFVRHAYFLGANDPYKALRTTLKAEINQEAWETLHSDTSRPFARPASGRIAVKVINHLGDEVMKVFRV